MAELLESQILVKRPHEHRVWATRALGPVFFIIGNLKTVPDQVALEEFDVLACSADDDPRVASRHLQTRARLKPSAVIAFQGYP